MLIGKENVQSLIRQAKPRVIWIKSGHLKSPGATIREIIKETSGDALQEFDTYLALLGPGQYSIQYMWCEGEDKGEGKTPTRQHAYGDSFDIPSTGYQGQGQQSQYPATVGNPYAAPGERTYTKAEVLEMVEDKVEREKAKWEVQQMRQDFTRQLKEAKEGGGMGEKLIAGLLPHLPQLLAGKGAPAAVAGPAVYQTPEQPEVDHGNLTPEQGARYDVATNQLLLLCGGDHELFVARLEKLIYAATAEEYKLYNLLGLLDNVKIPTDG